MRWLGRVYRQSTGSAGFTFVELLIAVTVMLVLVGGGIAAFVTFNDKQALLGEARELQTMLRSAQTRARVGDRPAGCTLLDGYTVRAAASSIAVQQFAVCDGVEILRSEYQFPNGISLASPLDVTFLVLHGGVVNADTVTLTSQTGLEYTFEITQGGEITIGELVETP